MNTYLTLEDRVKKLEALVDIISRSFCICPVTDYEGKYFATLIPHEVKVILQPYEREIVITEEEYKLLGGTYTLENKND